VPFPSPCKQRPQPSVVPHLRSRPARRRERHDAARAAAPHLLRFVVYIPRWERQRGMRPAWATLAALWPATPRAMTKGRNYPRGVSAEVADGVPTRTRLPSIGEPIFTCSRAQLRASAITSAKQPRTGSARSLRCTQGVARELSLIISEVRHCLGPAPATCAARPLIACQQRACHFT
jgi:hypothetical protein